MIYYTPPIARAEAARRPISVWKLLRTRWVRTFTASKIFSDPAWYFYIFWFPQYLKSARGFDIASIGKFAWIPFLTADAGNLLGGALRGRPAEPRDPHDVGAKDIRHVVCAR